MEPDKGTWGILQCWPEGETRLYKSYIDKETAYSLAQQYTEESILESPPTWHTIYRPCWIPYE